MGFSQQRFKKKRKSVQAICIRKWNECVFVVIVVVVHCFGIFLKPPKSCVFIGS